MQSYISKQLSELDQLQACGLLGIPDSVYHQYWSNVDEITENSERLQAQQHLIQELYRLHLEFKGKQRDSSKSSSMSSSSNCSSNTRSSHSSSMKLQLQSAIQHYNSLLCEQSRRKFLIEKGHLLSKDKIGFQILQKRLSEEIHTNFVEQLTTELIRQNNFSKMMLHPIANFVCQLLFKQSSISLLEKVLIAVKHDFAKLGMDAHGTRALQSLLEELVKRVGKG
jgi:hypothetical protein